MSPCKLSLFGLFLIVLLTSEILNTKNTGLNSRSLPKRPKTMVFQLLEGGGMYPEHKEVFISKDSSFYRIIRHGEEQKIAFTVNESELKLLYDVFLEENFSRIKMVEESDVKDRGGTTIVLHVDGIRIEKKDAGRTFVQRNNQEQFRTVKGAIWDFVTTQLIEKKIEIHFILNEALYNSGYYFYLSLNNERIVFSKEEKLKSDYAAWLLPGKNKIEASLYFKDVFDYSGFPKLLTLTSSFVDVKSNTKVFFLDFYHGAIQIKD